MIAPDTVVERNPHWNPFQPERPSHDENGIPFLYRRAPRTFTRRAYDPRVLVYMQTQVALYRWASSLEFRQKEYAGDLPKIISAGFSDGIQINSPEMGRVITNALIYKPTEPKYIKGMGVHRIYQFASVEDLLYGLEWQICMWLPKHLRAVEGVDHDVTITEDILTELGEAIIEMPRVEYDRTLPMAEICARFQFFTETVYHNKKVDWRRESAALKGEVPEVSGEAEWRVETRKKMNGMPF